MHWTEPATADDSHAALEKPLWDATNQLWAGANLKPSEYSPTVLGLIFPRHADVRFVAVKKKIQLRAGSWRKIGPANFHAAGVVYLPDQTRFPHLLSLPKSYHILESRTLLRMPGGLETPDSGTGVINNHLLLSDPAALQAYRRKNGFLFQQFNLFPHLTARHNISLPLEKVHGHPSTKAEQMATDALDRFGLLDHADKLPAQLSGGHQQRVGIARAVPAFPLASDAVLSGV